MDFYSQKSYVDLENALDDAFARHANALMLTVPGLSGPYFLKRYSERRPEVTYIDSENQALASKNLLVFDFDTDGNALGNVDMCFRKSVRDTRFVVLLNSPAVLDSDDFSQWPGIHHIYTTLFFGARNLTDTNIFAREINPNLTNSEIEKIYEISGGFGRWIKFLAINNHMLEMNLEDLVKNTDFSRVAQATIRVVSPCNEDVLKRLRIKNESGFVSAYLAAYFKQHPLQKKINIKILPDFTVMEDGAVSSATLTQPEKKILEFMVDNMGTVTKEKIAEIKWGDQSFEEFSDQAISKTMQRLEAKLSLYEILPISGVGYKLKNK
jgi:hypothetical protein